MTQSGFMDVGNGRLWYEVGGEGEPLVLVHAGFVDSRMWDDQWEAFTQRYHGIRFDQRGYGKSDPMQATVSRRADLLRLMDGLGVERAILLGCSMGGEAVLDIAIEHPERVSALIVVSSIPGGFEMQGPPPRYFMEMIQAAKDGDLERTSDLQIRLWVDGAFREPEQVDPVVRRRALEMNRILVQQRTFFADSAQPFEPLDPPANERLTEIQAPVLIIAGALDHPEILRAARLMEAEIPYTQTVILPDSAHVPNMEKPQEFTRAVLDFLSGLNL